MSKENINKAGMQVVLKGGRGAKKVFNNKEVMKIIDLINSGDRANMDLAEMLIESQKLQKEFCYHAEAYCVIPQTRVDTLKRMIDDFSATLRVLQNNFIGNEDLKKSIKKKLEEYQEEFHIEDTKILILKEMIKNYE